ncbi:DEKNAAC104652 [Brettanomyces naardenensis]|uniref:DEKNAAC104652 n=1 Tax=Brettanomyces naardenensis TaxID=13370 RepID=A0A448YR35_BRENA|nr:DEKNAAC104652 [Brettanomyces naardenensis]
MALKKTYILKPSMSDKGQGIRLFKTIDQLQDIFNSFDDESGDESLSEGLENGIILSQMRHFVIQEYLADPLLLPEYGNRKFHIRTYVLCSGNLKVYVYQRMLMLFSEYPYVSPTLNGVIDMVGHLTNTCLQEDTEETVVVEFEKSVLSDKLKQKILGQINEVVSELFKAALTVDRINFQPLPNAFETYGLDFLVDFHGDVQILEVNAYPDFKQTGDDLKGLIYELFDGVLAKAVAPFFSCAEGKAENMYKVFEKDDLFV